jgi:hypothetical protein
MPAHNLPVGAGLGGLSLDWNHPFSFDLLELFLEYDCYFLKSSVTPMAGHSISTILVSGPPYSSHLISEFLKYGSLTDYPLR